MNWPEILIGNVVSGIVGFVLSEVLTALAESPGRNARRYSGIYHGYYYSTSGNGEIVSEKWKIARRLLGGMSVRMEMTYRSQFLKFKGTFMIRDRHIYVHLSGDGHSEQVFFIFPEPVTGRITSCLGTFTALTVDKRPFAGKHLLTEDEVTARRAKNLLGEEQRVVATEPQELRRPNNTPDGICPPADGLPKLSV